MVKDPNKLVMVMIVPTISWYFYIQSGLYSQVTLYAVYSYRSRTKAWLTKKWLL